MAPEISIITINLNNHAGLLRTINSVKHQNPRLYEYIIVDGESSDGSIELIQQNSNFITSVICEKDSGVYYAMNKGLKLAKGNYVLFLNSGDEFYEPCTLENLYLFVSKFPADIYYGDILSVYENGESEKMCYPDSLTLSFFMEHNINHQASLTKTQLLKTFNGFNTSFKICADYHFFLKSFNAGFKFIHFNKVMVIYENFGFSGKNLKTLKEEHRSIFFDLVPEHIINILIENKDLKNFASNKLISILRKVYNSWKNLKCRL